MGLFCRMVIVFTLLASQAALTQVNSGLVAKVEAVKFPTLAQQARIQGDVQLRSGPNGVMVISGHPLLAQAAADSLKAVGKISDRDIEATYHFVLVENKETRIATRIEKRGNRFTRLFLRVFGMKTERVVEYRECVENPFPVKNKIDLIENRLEVSIYRYTACLQY